MRRHIVDLSVSTFSPKYRLGRGCRTSMQSSLVSHPLSGASGSRTTGSNSSCIRGLEYAQKLLQTTTTVYQELCGVDDLSLGVRDFTIHSPS